VTYQRAYHRGGPVLSTGMRGARTLKPCELEELLGQETFAQRVERELEESRRAFWAAEQRRQTPRGEPMTVSLYKSTAVGVKEMVVQTNAQSLDVFISGLADALMAAMEHTSEDERAAMTAATLRNAFPIAFSIAGYKADRVSEAKLLTCGVSSPDASELVAQSKQ
jgi:hypothetical protein